MSDRSSLSNRCWEGAVIYQIYPRSFAGRGEQRSLFELAPDVLAWVRERDGERVLVALNVGDDPRRCDLRAVTGSEGEVLVATSERRGAVPLVGLTLAPLEGLALRL